MRRQRLIFFTSYLAVGLAATLMAFSLSMKFLGLAHSQSTEGQASAAGEAAPPVPPQSAEPPEAVAPPTDDSGLRPEPSDSVSMMREFLEPFIYDANNRRDPFQPFADMAAPGPTGAPSLLATGQFDTDDYTLIGIMWDIREPKAMFVDPDKKVHVMGRDESIGRNNGYIAAIREGEVVVVESQKKQGDVIYKTKVIKISR